MRIVDISHPGGPEVLRIVDAPEPKPGEGEVLGKVAAAGINRADLLQREGHYPPPPDASPILGMEASGHIAEIGPDVDPRWKIGDAVCAPSFRAMVTRSTAWPARAPVYRRRARLH